MTKDEALRIALEAMEMFCEHGAILRPIETRDAIKAALEAKDEPDWKALVLNHNADCESRCDMDRCGYKPYFEHNKRRCPDCPVHETIDVECTPPQRKPLTDEEMQRIIHEHTKLNPNQCDDKQLIGYIINATRAIEAAHGIKGEAK
jgi:hypothetical protein